MDHQIDILQHYGVKGMKWGVRRAQSNDGPQVSRREAKRQAREPSDDVKRVNDARAKIKSGKSTNVLSNKELQDVVTRMNLEQQYKSLTTKQKESGSSATKALLKEHGPTVAVSALGFAVAKTAQRTGAKPNSNVQMALKLAEMFANASRGGKKKKN